MGFMYRAAVMGLMPACMLIPGCRGQKSEAPPIHIIQNMDNQAKYVPYGQNSFFADGRNMRPTVKGTVARGGLNNDSAYFHGKTDSQFVSIPVKLTMELMQRGRERYGIYCSVCHGLSGDGKSINVLKGFTPAPAYTDERLLKLRDGEIFNVISNGVRTMPSMAAQVPVEDRWAIVAYVRALQKSQLASIEDVPPDKQSLLK